MKFLIFVIDDLSASGTPEEMVEIDKFNDQLEADGHWIAAGGLVNPINSLLIDNRGDANQVWERSHFPVAEHYSGFWFISAPDKETAKRLALAGSKACNRKVEVRPLIG